jgi:type IV pilus assembly protein PilW
MRGARGFSLPELLVAMVLGLSLLAAFLAVLLRCRDQFATHESLARLHDAARHALSVLAPDIEHAGFYGFAHGAEAQVVGALPAGLDDCGTGFALALDRPVQGANNRFALGADATDCEPTGSAGGAREGTDVLTLRHAAFDTAAPRAGRLQIHSRRLTSHGAALLFADGRALPADADAEIRDLEIRSYYVANDSVGRRGWPALRVKALTEAGGGAQFRDEEVLPGVEDLQVEIGVLEDDGAEKRLAFLRPDDAGLAGRRVLAVRLWLRIRADRTEPGFRDSESLAYSDAVFAPSAADAAHRRLLISRTVALRNTP